MNYETLIINNCLDCGSGLLIGPSGGLSVNVCCSNAECRSAFNDMGPFGLERIQNSTFRAVFPSNPIESEHFQSQQWTLEQIVALVQEQEAKQS